MPGTARKTDSCLDRCPLAREEQSLFPVIPAGAGSVKQAESAPREAAESAGTMRSQPVGTESFATWATTSAPRGFPADMATAVGCSYQHRWPQTTSDALLRQRFPGVPCWRLSVCPATGIAPLLCCSGTPPALPPHNMCQESPSNHNETKMRPVEPQACRVRKRPMAPRGPRFFCWLQAVCRLAFSYADCGSHYLISTLMHLWRKKWVAPQMCRIAPLYLAVRKTGMVEIAATGYTTRRVTIYPTRVVSPN